MCNEQNRREFGEFFRNATGDDEPYVYQRELALKRSFPDVLSIPTGVGKTAAVIMAWLYRRRVHPDNAVRQSTPRRLVYCLPMRTLVEQTERVALQWIDNLAQYDGQFCADPVSVHVLMGGTEKTEWDRHPEKDAILIGTQDMLLSRALNRGYGMSRYRWPVHFALLNNDCLWVLDETQLMGVGLTSSAQLHGFRAKLDTYGTTQSLWMSATLDEGQLSTVDHPRPDGGWSKIELSAEDRAMPAVQRLIDAGKPCARANVILTPESSKSGYDTDLAAEILREHRSGTLTLAVINRVDRAQNVFREIRKQLEKQDSTLEICLIHSRFRPVERVPSQERALNEKTIPSAGRIVVATQAIEAGVDVSATTLFTELSPWPSLVQRFGRCNRRGLCGTDRQPEARVVWIDVDTSDERQSKQLSLPYVTGELDSAREHISALSDVSPKSLQAVDHEQQPTVVHTLRRKDLLELWDTTPDLAGNDLDVSRYIRDSEDTDVQVYWREWEKDTKQKRLEPPHPRDESGEIVFPDAAREELCPVSVVQAWAFVKRLKDETAWRWDPLQRSWRAIRPHEVRPGMVLLLHSDAGGYDAELGWTGNAKSKPTVEPVAREQQLSPEAMGDDDSGTQPVFLTQHLSDVVRAAGDLKEAVGATPAAVPWDSICRAALWHDVGKAHPAFQTAMRDSSLVSPEDPEGKLLWAKSGKKGILKYRRVGTDPAGNTCESERRGFRHELASAIAWLDQCEGQADEDLIAFLIAAHHGKVRGSIRSLPNESRPADLGARFARGLWDGDEIPPVDLGDGQVTRKTTVNLSLMELGGDENGRSSWLARVLKLRSQYGPFRLAYLETLLRLADWRGSNEGETSDA